MGEIYDELNKLAQSDRLPLHMPGHKRREEDEFFRKLYALDITEIDPFDNLHDAKGMIKRAEMRAAKLWGAKESHFLVNGSTCGNLTAVFATVPDGGEILIARNCHNSVYHALELRRVRAHYIYPAKHTEFDVCLGIRAAQVEEKLNEFPNSKAVLLTSPTYEGYVSEIKEIAALCHSRGIPLIVDEAHGAHFGFDDFFPESAVKLGADLVIQSLHKTLTSMTQTAVLHIAGNEFVDAGQVRKFLAYFQTSSPSYIFLASMEHCLDVLEGKGAELMQEYVQRLGSFYEEADMLKHLRILSTDIKDIKERDAGKLLLQIKGISGRELARTLVERFGIQYEMSTPQYVLLMTSIYDTDDTFERLTEALKELDNSIEEAPKEKILSRTDEMEFHEPESVYTLFEAAGKKSIRVSEKDAEGRISGKAVYLYPPGTPFILPGERFTKGILNVILSCEEAGFEVIGLEEGELWVLEEGLEKENG